MKTGTVLITGAYAFIGRHVARLYGEKGWKVFAVTWWLVPEGMEQLEYR